MDHARDHTHLCIYDNNSPVTPVYVKVLEEREGQHEVGLFSFYLSESIFPSFKNS